MHNTEGKKRANVSNAVLYQSHQEKSPVLPSPSNATQEKDNDPDADSVHSTQNDGNKLPEENHVGFIEDDTLPKGYRISYPIEYDDSLGFIDETIENVNKIRFPNGNVKYKVRGVELILGWCRVQFSRYRSRNGDTTTNKTRCLGCMGCPEPGCNYRKRSKLPKQRNIFAQPSPLKLSDKCCKIHGCELEHVSCCVIIETKTHHQDGYVEVTHIGTHTHDSPAPISISKSAKKIIEKTVRRHPQQGTVTMQTGTSYSNRLPVHQDESLVRVLLHGWQREKKN